MSNTKQLLFAALAALVVFSCSEDSGSDIAEELTITQAEVEQVIEADAFSGIVDDILTDLSINGEAISGRNRPDCYEAIFTETGYTVTFTDCVIEDSEIINGTITVEYASGENSFSFMATFTDFSIGAIEIEGTRSFSIDSNQISEESSSFTVTVTSDMTIVLEDGTVITENGTKLISFLFESNFEGGALTIDGNWTIGINDDTYSVVVDEILEQSFDCDYVGSGILSISKNGLEVIVDFGDGTCDAIATIEYPDGTTEDIALND